jgi:hypothetical protein
LLKTGLQKHLNVDLIDLKVVFFQQTVLFRGRTEDCFCLKMWRDSICVFGKASVESFHQWNHSTRPSGMISHPLLSLPHWLFITWILSEILMDERISHNFHGITVDDLITRKHFDDKLFKAFKHLVI